MPHPTPKVSIITVCYNAAEALRATIESVEALTYPDIEFVIVDGASTDHTDSVIQDHRQSISVLISEPDNGIYDAMNKGVKAASGKWVIFMNAGDRFADANVVSMMMKADDGNIGVIYGNIYKCNSSNQLQLCIAEQPHNSHRMFFCHQSAFTRRDLLLSTPFSLKHPLSADIHQVKRLLKQGVKMLHTDVVVAVFDTTGVSNRQRSRGLRDNISVVCELDNFADKIRFIPRLLLPYISCRLRGK